VTAYDLITTTIVEVYDRHSTWGDGGLGKVGLGKAGANQLVGNALGPSMAKTAVAGLDMKLVEIAMAYQRSRVLCAAARLGVADALKEGERSVQEIAGSCAADSATLHRLLRTLAAMGVVAQVGRDTFVLTKLGETLRKDAANSAWSAIIFWADLLADNWSCLTECVRTGESAASLRPEIMKRWREDPEGPAIFRAVMGTSPAESYLPIARAWDFSDGHVVADLGGGGGAMIEAILETFPKVRGHARRSSRLDRCS